MSMMLHISHKLFAAAVAEDSSARKNRSVSGHRAVIDIGRRAAAWAAGPPPPRPQFAGEARPGGTRLNA